MQHPSHYVQFRKEELVCKLIYSYGLKQSPHWNEKFFCERMKLFRARSGADPCCENKRKKLEIIAVYYALKLPCIGPHVSV